MANGNTHLTTAALRVVLAEEEPHALTEVLRDLERARMTAEDYRGAMFSPYPFPEQNRQLTWKQVGKVHIMRCVHFRDNVVQPAVDMLGEARAMIRTQQTNTAYNKIIEAEGVLREESDTDMDETGPHCVLCRSSDRNTRNFFSMVPAGRWEGIAPGGRIVCSLCRREDMGAIEFFS